MNRLKRYELHFKHEVCRKYIRGGFTKKEIQDQYGIMGKSTLLKWLRQLGYLSGQIQPAYLTEELLKTESSESKAIKALKTKLLEAELKAEAYQRMIVIAENKYKIEIQKKKDTK